MFMPKPKELKTDPAFREYKEELDKALKKQKTAEKALETLLSGQHRAAENAIEMLSEPDILPRGPNQPLPLQDRPEDSRARFIINTVKADAAAAAAMTLEKMRNRGLAKEAVKLIGEYEGLLPMMEVDGRPYLLATVNGRRASIDSATMYRQTPDTKLRLYINSLYDHAEILNDHATAERTAQQPEETKRKTTIWEAVKARTRKILRKLNI